MAGRKTRDTPQGIALTLAEDEIDVVIAGLVSLLRSAQAEELYEEGELEGDGDFADLAGSVLDRIAALLPDEPPVPAPRPRKGDAPHRGPIARAIQAGTKLSLAYVDRKDKASARTIWPLELGSFGAGDTVAAWCETRRDFRHFRLDRIQSLTETGERFPGHRRILLARLRLQEFEQSYY